MNYELTGSTISYVRQHADDDVRLLALRGCKDPAVDLTMALQQIQGRQMARSKLPTWAAIDAIVYPPHINMEQCSSEQTARYTAALCRRLLSILPSVVPSLPYVAALPQPITPSLLDLTGGLGVDFAFMQESFAAATYVERDPQLFAIAKQNFRTLSLSVDTVNTDGTAFLTTQNHVTLTFLDPARRDANGQRTYGIADCTPDVLTLLPLLLEKSTYVLLKLSPMLDWRKAVSDLGEQNVREVHIVSVQNECKELLILLSSKAPSTAPTLHCVNDDSIFTLDLPVSSPFIPPTSSLLPHPSSFLLEPNASIMKAGCFAALAQRYHIEQLSHDSHLFISSHSIDSFPGRQFQIIAVSSMNKHDLKIALQGLTHANITTRNFPLSAPTLRQRLKLADGGNTYIFATTTADGSHILLVCKKI